MLRSLVSLASVIMLLSPAIGRADTVLEFSAREEAKGRPVTQSMTVKDGRILFKGAGSGSDTEYLFDRWAGSITVIDHRKRTVSIVDEKQVELLNQQAGTVQPLLQGVAERVASLSPEERKRWQDLLGESISLDKIAQSAQPPPATTLVAIGRNKVVSGVTCRPMRIMQGATAMADLCLADQTALGIHDGDYATIRALMELYERLAGRSQRVARQFGVNIPALSARELKGVPVELRNLSQGDSGSLTFRRITNDPVSPELMKVPAGYRKEPLAPWQ